MISSQWWVSYLFAAGWSKDSVIPDGGINVALLFGHHNDNWAVFTKLYQLEKGDHIIVYGGGKALATRYARSARNNLTFLLQANTRPLRVRQEQKTGEFQFHYALRVGIEATISQFVRSFALRCSCYIGLVKSHLQIVATVAAHNLHRLFDWRENQPHAKTRISSFAHLTPNLAPRFSMVDSSLNLPTTPTFACTHIQRQIEAR